MRPLGKVERGDAVETEMSSKIFNAHYSKDKIPNFLKLGEISDDMKNTLSKLPSKKKLSSRQK